MSEHKSEIQMYFHCRKCVAEGCRPNIAVGITKRETLRVWCDVHDCLVIDFDDKTQEEKENVEVNK
jgi:hypothetical protein